MTEGIDLSDARQVRERTKKARERDKENQELVKAIMSMPQGRQWIYHLLEYCGVYRSPFSTNALTMSHSVGMGEVGRMVLAELIASDETLYLQMVKENRDVAG